MQPLFLIPVLALSSCRELPLVSSSDLQPVPATSLSTDLLLSADVLPIVRVSENPDNAFSAIVSVTLDHDATVHVAYGEDALTHSTPPATVAARRPTDIVVLGLRADRDFQLEVVEEDAAAPWRSETLHHRTAPLPAGWPTCTTASSVDPGEHSDDEVVCTQGMTSTGRLMYFCTDYSGEPVFEIKADGDDALMSMRPLMDGSWASTTYSTSALVFHDRFGAQTASYRPSYFTGTRFTHEYIDFHELIQISEGPWAGAVVFLTSAYEWFDTTSYRLGSGLIVFDPDTREVLYDYSFHGALGDQVAMDPRLPYSRTGSGDYAEDWNHANALVHGLDADGRDYFLVALKAQDWIVKLYPDTDEIAWTLGDDSDLSLVEDLDDDAPVEQPAAAWPYHLHGLQAVSDDDGLLRLFTFDNGTTRPGEASYSRVVELRVDEDRGLVDTPFTYGAADPSDPSWLFSPTCGNAVLLQDRQRLLALDGEGATMLELSYPDGAERWRMTCEIIEWCEYRVSWHPSLYDTDWIYQ